MCDAFLSIEFNGSQQAKCLVCEDVCRCSHRNHPTGFHRLKRVFVLLKANVKVSHDGQVKDKTYLTPSLVYLLACPCSRAQSPKSSNVSKFWVTRWTSCLNFGCVFGQVLCKSRQTKIWVSIIIRYIVQVQISYTHFRYSKSSGNSLEPDGSNGPSISLRCSQSKPLNQGWRTTWRKPFSNSSSVELPIRDSGPASKQDKKSMHSGDSWVLISAGI